MTLERMRHGSGGGGRIDQYFHLVGGKLFELSINAADSLAQFFDKCVLLFILAQKNIQCGADAFQFALQLRGEVLRILQR